MKVYQGHSASPGLVMGQVSRLERWHENFATGPFNAEREQRLLENAVRTAQRELDGMADRSGPTEQAIFLFQSMMLEDEGFMNEVKFQIKAGISAAEAMYRAGNRYAEQLAAMEDNAYMQLRSADILDAARRADQPSPGLAGAGSPGDPGGRDADAQRSVQRSGGNDPGHHHFGGQ